MLKVKTEKKKSNFFWFFGYFRPPTKSPNFSIDVNFCQVFSDQIRQISPILKLRIFSFLEKFSEETLGKF